MQDFLFSYDDICLKPKFSELPSRSKADTSVDFLGKKWRIPVVPANMQDVVSWKVARGLVYSDYFYIMHRFDGATRDLINYKDSFENSNFISISVGVNQDSIDDLLYLTDKHHIRPQVITIDVAQGHHQKVREMMELLYGLFDHGDNRPKFIAGNVATADGYKFLCDIGADAVKVGIGGGSICTTRYKTGFHIPTAYSVWDCATNGGRNIPIIADGGAKHFGDVAKALVLGADMVMSGRWFAECLDSPAKIEHGKKVYRGSTSFDFKKLPSHIEGQTIQIEEGCSYPDRLREIQEAIQSSISYAGGTDLSAFNGVEWFTCR